MTRPLFYSICCLLLLLSCGGIVSKQTQQQKDDTLSGKEIKTDTITYDTINFKTMKSQEKYTIIKKFDIESYKKKRDTDINFTDRDGMLVRQWSGENELDGKYYIDERHYPNSPYLYCIEYDEKGRIKNFITNFYHIIIGKTIYYNTFGGIVKEVDEDAPYKFSINDLIVKMKCEYNMLIEDKNKVWNVGRYIEDHTPLYVISEKNGDFHENLYLINGYNGKTLYIKKDSYRDVDSDNICTEEELNETLYQEYKRVKKIK